MSGNQFCLRLSVVLITLHTFGGSSLAQSNQLNLKVENLMTTQELRTSGVSALTPSQRKVLDAWLNRYTERVIALVDATKTPRTKGASSACSPAIESAIAGDFNGWDGETLFKLDNGQLWEQAEYDYMYSYSYRPDVTIYETDAGCRMKVEDEDETILVRRIH